MSTMGLKCTLITQQKLFIKLMSYPVFEQYKKV